MKRQDVQIGVEYAETAPLAFGREPRTQPVKVRFTDTRPGPWVRIITQQRGQAADALGLGWITIDVQIKRERDLTDLEAALPRSMRKAMELGWGVTEPVTRKRIGGTPYETTRVSLDVKNIPVGATIVHIEDRTKGLPGERWRRDEQTNEWRWFPGIIETAAVHRTWAEVEQTTREATDRREALNAEARIPEITALLHAAGLDQIFTDVSRTGSGSARTAISTGGLRSGEALLAQLIAWADVMLGPDWRLNYKDALSGEGITDDRWEAGR